METLFFILVRTGNSLHHRMQYFKEEKTCADFMIWVDKMVEEIKTSENVSAVVIEDFKIKWH